MYGKCPQYKTEYTQNFKILKSKLPEADNHCSATRKFQACQINQCKALKYASLLPLDRNIHSGEQKKSRTNNEEVSECFTKQPNRFLKHLNYQYPDLYKFLKLKHQYKIVTKRPRTTTQIDYGHVPEHVEGIYAADIVYDKEKVKKVDPYKITGSASYVSDCRPNALSKATTSHRTIKQYQTGHFPEIQPIILL